MRVELVAGDLPLRAPSLSISIEDARPDRRAAAMRTGASWVSG
jgi:hypothetical protein